MAIEITGLSKRQMILADILWSIEDWNQVERFIASLPKKDRIDCEGILELMRMALVEEYADQMKSEGHFSEEYAAANEVIDKIRGLK
jgi:hypothetical protein